MKRFTFVLLVLCFAAIAAQAQGNANCCVLSAGSPQIANRQVMTVPPEGNNSGGEYIASETQKQS
jgi:hypothetical protein